MHERYLGDSYDIVKRFWAETLSPVAPLFAHPRFIPADLQKRFSKFTKIQIWPADQTANTPYSLLLDPHTGIPLPDAANQRERISHSPINFIAELFRACPNARL